ncbi:MAG: hypothetical protein K2X03_24930 [Bryobacteraceae bacterium]|nr:hypothetical protein [Bryobacteraceae bacterium]
MDPASFTPGASLGRMVLPNAGFPSVGGVVQNSQNLGFAYLRTAVPGIITPPAGFANPGGVPFDPTTPGHYTFALRAFDLLGNQVAQVVIHVSTLADPNAVTPPAGSYQVRYFSNLNAGDSFINITNTGERGAGLAAGTTANTTGAICVNAYVFSPDEQMVSCCSCPVTPNGLVSMSASSLVSNTLTPAVPTSIVVKLVSTIPTVANGCTNSAAAIQPLAPIPQPNGLTVGMLAWATTLHAPAVAGLPFATTETPFAPATLSTVAGAGDNIGELNRLARLCNFINANGSGFGICRACRLGGLGAGRL